MKRFLQRLPLALLAALLGTGLLSTAFAGEFEYSLDAKGNLSLKRDGAEVLKTDEHFFGPNWAWNGVEGKETSKNVWDLSAKGLGIAFKRTLQPPAAGKFVYQLAFSNSQQVPGAMGGGYSFQFALDKSVHRDATADPILLPDNKGWEWNLGPGKVARVTFDPAPAKVYFEQGKKSEIRAYFFSGEIPKGDFPFTMTMEIPKDAASLDQRYGTLDPATMIPNPLVIDKSFVDLSYLNEKPAGGHGFVMAKDGKYAFADGSPARFWACNIQAYSIYVKATNAQNGKQIVEDQSRRIASLGFNLVRLHHHDSKAWVTKCLIADGPTSQEIDEEALDSYFYWIKCLKDAGVYVWVDLYTGRTFTKGDDIPGWDEISRGARDGRPNPKGFTYVNARLTELMKAFNEKLLTRVNPYTGLKIVEEPAVMGILIQNENDLTAHFGNAMNADKNVPYHNGLIVAAGDAFAAKNGLDKEAVKRFWEPGVSKLFLNDEEAVWFQDMEKHLRGFGVKVPICAGHMWGMGISSLPSLTAGDVIDGHSYEPGEFLDNNPRYKGNFATGFVRSHVANLPMTVTEYNSSDQKEVRDPFTIPLYMAALSAFQGIDAPFLFAYSQDAFENMGANGLLNNGYKCPAVIGLCPAAALLYRRDVSAGKELYVAQLDREKTFMQNNGDTRAFRTLELMHPVRIALGEAKELPWLKATPIPAGATVFTDLEKDYIPEGQSFVESDTKELRRDWSKGLLTIDTPRSQGVQGWLKENGKIALSAATFEMATPKASVIVSSLDGKPLKESRKMLVSTAARIDRKGEPAWSAQWVAEPVTGTITIQSDAASMKLVPLKGDGSPYPALPMQKQGNAFVVQIPANSQTLWYGLEAE